MNNNRQQQNFSLDYTTQRAAISDTEGTVCTAGGWVYIPITCGELWSGEYTYLSA